MSEYQEALARARERQAARSATHRIESRARLLLREIGWDATRAALQAATLDVAIIREDEREAVVARATELQSDESVRGRRLRPEDIEMPKPAMTRETAERVRDYVRRRRRAEPDVKAAVVHAAAADRFGFEISGSSWYTSFWCPVSAELRSNGKAKAAPARKPAAAEKPAAAKPRAEPVSHSGSNSSHRARLLAVPQPPARVTPDNGAGKSVPAIANGNGAPTVVGPPVLQLLPLSNGKVRIQADVDFELGAALATLAAAITGQRDRP